MSTSEFRYCPHCKAACTRRVGFHWRTECYRCSNKFCWVCLGPIQHSIPFTCLNETAIAQLDVSLGFTMALVFTCLLLVHVIAVLGPILAVIYLIFFDWCFVSDEAKRKPTCLSMQVIKAKLEEGKLLIFFKEVDTSKKSACAAWALALLISLFVNLPVCTLACVLLSFVAWWVLPWIALTWVFCFVSRVWYYALS